MGAIILPAYLLGIWLLYIAYKAFRRRSSVVVSLLFTLIVSLPFTYDIVITNLLAGYYCLVASPHPKTKIEKRVEYPLSIYWEDNVYKGFSRADREPMVLNYLDGTHLKMMALNGDDGKIYVYYLDKPLWRGFKAEAASYLKAHPEYKNNISGHQFDVYSLYAKKVMKSEKIYTKETMPKTNYTVTFNEIKLNSFIRRFLYSDETKIIENNTSKTIAYNRRYARLFYNIEPKFFGNDLYHYYKTVMCGDSYTWFTYHIFKFDGISTRDNHYRDLNEFLYYVKGGK